VEARGILFCDDDGFPSGEKVVDSLFKIPVVVGAPDDIL
jgi:hypothetical protein